MLRLCFVLCVLVTHVLSGSPSGLSRSWLMRELKNTEDHLKGLQALEEMIRDFIWLDDTRVLAFRVTAGIGQKAHLSFLTSAGDSPLSYVCGKHYRNDRLFDSWPSSLVDTVRVSMMKKGTEQAFIDFNGRGSDFDSWFSKDRVINSTWTDLTSQPTLHFSMRGITTNQPLERRFYIAKSHGGCANDWGWLVVLESYDVCNNIWTYSASEKPAILFSNVSHNTNFASDNIDQADELIISVSFRDLLSCAGGCP